MKNFSLPKDYRPYIDKYFLRSKEILKQDGLNPVVKYQVFIRNANCKIYGIDEAIAIVSKYAPNAKIYSIKEGDYADNCETIMVIEAPVQDIIDLETMYLGVISSETTLQVDKRDIDLVAIERNMFKIVNMVKPRPVMYFGARHWRYDRDRDISKACFAAGAEDCSTDIGALPEKHGVGTIPHALEAIYHWYNKDISLAVVESTKAFDKYMSKEIPRIALLDYANQEIIDTIQLCAYCSPSLTGIRIDTCGEHCMQGVLTNGGGFISGSGVSAAGVYIIRKILNDNGFNEIDIILSSGFANPEKTKAFIDCEKEIKYRLFDSLGVGQVFHSRCATGDIVEVDGIEIHKVGRPYRPNPKLIEVT
jgi:nicotinate phosphoribosyltransferase